jgi:hypothetical protein
MPRDQFVLFNAHSTKEQAACGCPKQDQLAGIEALPEVAVRGNPVPVPSPWSRPLRGRHLPPSCLHAFMPSEFRRSAASGCFGKEDTAWRPPLLVVGDGRFIGLPTIVTPICAQNRGGAWASLIFGYLLLVVGRLLTTYTIRTEQTW